MREKARIDDVVSSYVTLRKAGGGSLKGLCPFHDEKSPSFNVTPARNFWHCFGCGEGGDVIAFVMKIDGLGFSETVERLADKYGVQLRREEGDAPALRRRGPQRSRLIEAHKAAQEFYAESFGGPDALVARQFLHERGFDQEACADSGLASRHKATTYSSSTCAAAVSATRSWSLAAWCRGAGSLRPIPWAPALADPRRDRRHDRVRRPADLR